MCICARSAGEADGSLCDAVGIGGNGLGGESFAHDYVYRLVFGEARDRGRRASGRPWPGPPDAEAGFGGLHTRPQHGLHKLDDKLVVRND